MPLYKPLLESLRRHLQREHIKNGERWKKDGITDKVDEYYEKVLKRDSENEG